MARRQRQLRGHIEERPNGTFRAIVYAGIDPLTKKPRYLKKTVPNEAQAQVELTRMQNQVDEQRHPRSSISIGGVIAIPRRCLATRLFLSRRWHCCRRRGARRLANSSRRLMKLMIMYV